MKTLLKEIERSKRHLDRKRIEVADEARVVADTYQRIAEGLEKDLGFVYDTTFSNEVARLEALKAEYLIIEREYKTLKYAKECMDWDNEESEK